jgi:hypothetical protein
VLCIVMLRSPVSLHGTFLLLRKEQTKSRDLPAGKTLIIGGDLWRPLTNQIHHDCTAVQAVVVVTPVLIGIGHFWTTVNKKRQNRLAPKFAQVIRLVPPMYVINLVAIVAEGHLGTCVKYHTFVPFSHVHQVRSI